MRAGFPVLVLAALATQGCATFSLLDSNLGGPRSGTYDVSTETTKRIPRRVGRVAVVWEAEEPKYVLQVHYADVQPTSSSAGRRRNRVVWRGEERPWGGFVPRRTELQARLTDGWLEVAEPNSDRYERVIQLAPWVETKTQRRAKRSKKGEMTFPKALLLPFTIVIDVAVFPYSLVYAFVIYPIKKGYERGPY